MPRQGAAALTWMPSAQAKGNVTVSVSSDESLIVTGDRRSDVGDDPDQYWIVSCNSTQLPELLPTTTMLLA